MGWGGGQTGPVCVISEWEVMHIGVKPPGSKGFISELCLWVQKAGLGHAGTF